MKKIYIALLSICFSVSAFLFPQLAMAAGSVSASVKEIEATELPQIKQDQEYIGNTADRSRVIDFSKATMILSNEDILSREELKPSDLDAIINKSVPHWYIPGISYEGRVLYGIEKAKPLTAEQQSRLTPHELEQAKRVEGKWWSYTQYVLPDDYDVDYYDPHSVVQRVAQNNNIKDYEYVLFGGAHGYNGDFAILTFGGACYFIPVDAVISYEHGDKEAALVAEKAITDYKGLVPYAKLRSAVEIRGDKDYAPGTRIGSPVLHFDGATIRPDLIGTLKKQPVATIGLFACLAILIYLFVGNRKK